MQKLKSYGKLGYFVDKICLKAINQESAILYHIAKNWIKIVGEDLATASLPGRISKMQDYFVLTIYISHPAINLAIQAKENIILESIAKLIGYRMVRKIRFKHVANLRTIGNKNKEFFANKAEVRGINKKEHQKIDDSLKQVENPKLLEILQSLKEDYFI